AEDGIRDRTVTGVQTCALPISATSDTEPSTTPKLTAAEFASVAGDGTVWLTDARSGATRELISTPIGICELGDCTGHDAQWSPRSAERRVGQGGGVGESWGEGR